MTITDLMKMNNKRADEIVEEIALYLGQGIASLGNIFDPEIIVLMGGMREAGNEFLNIVKKHVKKYSIIPRNIPVKWSKIEHPGILGASILARGLNKAK